MRSRPALASLLACAALAAVPSASGGSAPEIRADAWLNTAPLGPKSLQGKVVLVDFWTYG